MSESNGGSEELEKAVMANCPLHETNAEVANGPGLGFHNGLK